ncbi:hypothetical protein PV327_011573, partial [Microctonus hyperodae]
IKLLLETLSFMIGDLIPQNNLTWDLFLLLREIHCNLLNPEITKESAMSLQLLIAKYHNLYRKLFDDTLRPKFHYPRLLLRNGPMYALSALRFEANHKQLKENANFGPSITIQDFQPPEYHLFKHYTPESELNSYSVIVSWVEINGTKYNPNMIISIKLESNVINMEKSNLY